MQLDEKIVKIDNGDLYQISDLSPLEIEIICKRYCLLERQVNSLIATNKNLVDACLLYKESIDKLIQESDNFKKSIKYN